MKRWSEIKHKTEPTSLVLGWPAPRWGWNIDEYRTVNSIRSDAKRAAYIRSIRPANVVLVEASADE